VFDAILEKAHTLCGADAGSFAINNGGERLPAVATRGYADEHAAHARHGLLITEPSMERLARGETIHIADLSLRDPHSKMALRRSADQIARAIAKTAVELTGSRTCLAVPLRKDGRLLGYLSAQRRQVRPFSDREVALLQNFAAQAVIAMENVRLITETREALEQQTATAEVLQVINASPSDVVPVFDAILKKARAVCGFARGSLNVYDGAYFRTVATHGIPEPFAALLRQPRRTGPQARFLEGDRIVHIMDVSAERLPDDPVVYRAALDAGDRTVVFVPLRHEQRLPHRQSARSSSVL